MTTIARGVTKTSLIFLIALVTSLVFLILVTTKTTHAATIEVNSTADTQANDGECTLREAIVSANTNTVSGGAANECVAGDSGADTINFNIPGSEVHTIYPTSDLPKITEKVTVNGYSQTGSIANTTATPEPFDNTITINIDGLDASYPLGLYFDIGSDESELRGISITNFKGQGNNYGQVTVNADDVIVAGNYLGVNPDGISQPEESQPNNRQSAAINVLPGANDTVIGGTNPADRNLIAGRNIGVSPLTSQGVNTYIYGNYTCLAKDGISSLDCNAGVVSSGGNMIVGGTESGQRNVLSGSSGVAIVATIGTFVVQGNYIGTDYTGAHNPKSHSGTGIAFTYGGAGNAVGGTNPGEGNVITGNGAAVTAIQVVLQHSGPTILTPNKNAILGNSIKNVGILEYQGFGDTNLGIDHLVNIDNSNPSDYQPDQFQSQGPTPNDVGDGDTGPNGFINTPVLKTAQQVGNSLTITYDLDAFELDTNDDPVTEFRVEFFANDESSIFGYGPGETYLGSATVTPGTDKTAVLTVGADYTNKALSSTTTAVDSTTASGFGSTSEFSRNISIGSASDFDSDGADDSIEDNAPNNGDGNNDGTPDRLQPTVSSFLDYDGTNYITFIAEGCSENGTVASIDASTLSTSDNGYIYPHGMNDFELNCSRGDTVDITIYTHDPDTNIDSLLPRKYNPNTNVFADIEGSTLQRETVGTSNAIKLAYSITDGGTYDDDQTANGIIVDPVGLATETTTTDTTTTTVGSPNTGLGQYWLLGVNK